MTAQDFNAREYGLTFEEYQEVLADMNTEDAVDYPENDEE